MTKPAKIALPPLLFGNDSAQTHTDVQSFGDKVDALFPGLTAYEPMPVSGGIFRSKRFHAGQDDAVHHYQWNEYAQHLMQGVGKGINGQVDDGH